jgi:origin recognition complex subunit 1
MDELDQLLTAKQDVVYNFFNWPTMRDSQLFVIAVANRMDLPQHLAAKIKSRLGTSPSFVGLSVQTDYSGLQTILFQPYDRQNLIEIVQSRLIPHPHAPSAADHKVLLPDAIALAATRMAGTNGDARRVLDACR